MDFGGDITTDSITTARVSPLSGSVWDIESLHFVQSSSLRFKGGNSLDPYGIHFKPDGTKLFTIGTGEDTVYEYSLSTPWDISSGSNGSGAYVDDSANILALGVSEAKTGAAPHYELGEVLESAGGFNGLIDLFRLYDTALAADEILTNYNNSKDTHKNL